MMVHIIGVGGMGRRIVKNLIRGGRVEAKFFVIDKEGGVPEGAFHIRPDEVSQYLDLLLGADRSFVVGALGGEAGSSAVELMASHPAVIEGRVDFYLILPFSVEEHRRKRAERVLRLLRRTDAEIMIFDNDSLLRLNGGTIFKRAISIFPLKITEVVFSFFRVPPQDIEFEGYRRWDLEEEIRVLEKAAAH